MSATPPQPERAGSQIAVAFARLLRGCGLTVPISSTIAFTAALAAVGLDRREPVYWAGRTTLVHDPRDVATFDAAFDVFFGGDSEPTTLTEDLTEDLTLTIDDNHGDSDGDGGADDSPSIELRFSTAEVLGEKDFADYSDAELDEAQRMMTQLRLIGSPRRSRRLRPSRHRHRAPDLRRTVRSALRSGGETIRRFDRKPAQRQRRLVLLLDVSGSMEPYARALLRFVHSAVVARQRVEAFALGTRLTRLTRELSSRDPDAALRNAAASALDIGGGTRLGAGLAQFNDEWGQRGSARGAIVVIMSDGWDRGDPELLAEQMERLHRLAHRLIWVNPLKVTPGYAPLARGMAAALPHVDAFVEGHSLDALEALAADIAASSTPTTRGAQSANPLG